MKLLFLACFTLSTLLLSCGSGPEHDEISAQVIMEQFVAEKLKAPATAEFEYGFSSKIKTDD